VADEITRYAGGVPADVVVSPYVAHLLGDPAPHRVWWLAVHTSTGVAIGGLRLSTRPGKTGRDVIGDAVSIEELSVDPAAQRTGVGTALLVTAESWLRGRPDLPQTLDLGVAVDNAPALALYRKLGYAVVERDGVPIVFAGADGRPCHVMAKRLAGGQARV